MMNQETHLLTKSCVQSQSVQLGHNCSSCQPWHITLKYGIYCCKVCIHYSLKLIYTAYSDCICTMLFPTPISFLEKKTFLNSNMNISCTSLFMTAKPIFCIYFLNNKHTYIYIFKKQQTHVYVVDLCVRLNFIKGEILAKRIKTSNAQKLKY